MKYIKKENIIRDKSYDFAIKIVELSIFLQNQNEYILSRQILRSGTSIGALVRESEFAESKKDFIHKLSIALKEANETDFWLDLLSDSSKNTNKKYDELKNDLNELLKILISIINKSKSNLQNK